MNLVMLGAGAATAVAPHRVFVPGWDPDSPLNPEPRYLSRRPARTGPPPEKFDAREAWRGCKSIGTIRDQGQCGSCWAFGSTTAFTDRWCIATNQTENPTFSVQTTLSCTHNHTNGCLGGVSPHAWDFFFSDGLPTEECRPYTVPTCPGPKSYGHNPCWGPPLPGSHTEHPTPVCPAPGVCLNRSVPATRHHTTGYHYTPGPTDTDIMHEVSFWPASKHGGT